VIRFFFPEGKNQKQNKKREKEGDQNPLPFLPSNSQDLPFKEKPVDLFFMSLDQFLSLSGYDLQLVQNQIWRWKEKPKKEFRSLHKSLETSDRLGSTTLVWSLSHNNNNRMPMNDHQGSSQDGKGHSVNPGWEILSLENELVFEFSTPPVKFCAGVPPPHSLGPDRKLLLLFSQV